MAPTNPADLSIDLRSANEGKADRPTSSPINLEGVDLSSFGGDFTGLDLPSLPLRQRSPPSSPRQQQRDPASKNLLNNFKSRISPGADSKGHMQEQMNRTTENGEDYRQGNSSMSKIYHLRKAAGSTPELSLVGSAENVNKVPASSQSSISTARPQPTPQQSEESLSTAKRDKPFRNPLIRRKSRRDSNSNSKPKFDGRRPSLEEPPNTAPLSSDWPGSEMRMQQMGRGDKRGKSAERAAASESDENPIVKDTRPFTKEKERSGFGKNVVSKARSGGGSLLTRLGKIGRSSSSHEKEVPDSEYVLKVINLPLVEQTRVTRISKDLGSCRDKTEYWMPSLPWRCIDYLNLNCESEGLYRVPGSGPQVKHWQRRFDTELDVDLLSEVELYDPNNIGSMFKSWLRDLPTEIMPSKIQLALGVELEKDNPDYAKMGQPAPQKLRDALSELPPFNYYLLFAITCHLSLLLSHKEQNKMDLNNLSICIGPCLKLERWLFNYLVGEWRHCWQGCFTEKKFLEIETAHERGSEPKVPASDATNNGVKSKNNGTHKQSFGDERVQSSGSASVASKSGSQETQRRPIEPYAPLELRRPGTSEDFMTSMEPSLMGTPKPKTGHNRSQSDLLASSPRTPKAGDRNRD